MLVVSVCYRIPPSSPFKCCGEINSAVTPTCRGPSGQMIGGSFFLIHACIKLKSRTFTGRKSAKCMINFKYHYTIGGSLLNTCTISILPINAALLLVGFADLITTIFWVTTGQAIEFNPIMASVLKAGIPCFVFAKVSTLVAYVGVMEWYRRSRSYAFAQMVGRVTVTAYLSIYTISLAIVNSGFFLG